MSMVLLVLNFIIFHTRITVFVLWFVIRKIVICVFCIVDISLMFLTIVIMIGMQSLILISDW